jgi:hypothetical protein
MQVPSEEREGQFRAKCQQSQNVSEEVEDAAAHVVSEISVMGGGEKQKSLQQTQETDVLKKI